MGPDQTRKITRALEKRLRNLNRNCPICSGSGFYCAQMFTACGMKLQGYTTIFPCKCGTDAEIAAWRERQAATRSAGNGAAPVAGSDDYSIPDDLGIPKFLDRNAP